jgi:hypothetical protein
MAGWNIEFHDPNPAKQAEGDFMLAAFKMTTGFQMDMFRKAWFGDDAPKSNQPDIVDGMVNFAFGDDIYKT